MDHRNQINGRCFCGKVQFSLEPPTDFVSHCHCESCRLSHSSAFVTWTSVPKERFILESGEKHLKWYRSSEWIEWGFCKECGGQMLYRSIKEGHHESPKQERMYISVGSLTSPIDRDPNAHVSYEEKIPWFTPRDDLPKFRGKGSERIEN